MYVHTQMLDKHLCIFGSIRDWGTKNECLTKKSHMTILNFYLFYIIIIVMNCYMPIDKMMSS